MELSSTIGTAAAKPKLLVLGATGGTGRHVVTQALVRGFNAAVLARFAEKAGNLSGAKVVVGNALDEAALRPALDGCDSVVSALGTPASPVKQVTLLSSATRVLVEAMKAENAVASSPSPGSGPATAPGTAASCSVA